jgi:DNA-directed RNA polymerase subunit RPC12/RpoP
MWEYICPKCRKTVKKNSHKCPHCGERFPLAIRVPPTFLKDPEKLEEYVHKHIFPRVSAFERNYLTKYFTEYFNDGFESGDLSAWTGKTEDTGDTVSVVSTDPHHGTYHASCYTDDTGWWGEADFYKIFGSAYSELYSRAYFKFKTQLMQDNGYNTLIFALRNSLAYPYNFLVFGYTKDASGYYWHMEGQGFSDQTSSLISLSVDTWYCIEVRVKVAQGEDSSGIVSAWVDDDQIFNVTGLDNEIGSDDINEILLGFYQTRNSMSYEQLVYVDCVVVADAYIGPEEEGPTLVEVADSLELAETVLRNKTLILSDSLGLADSLYGNKSFLLSDSASLSELVTVMIGEVMKYITDSVSSADLVLTPSRVLRTLEAIGAADNVAVNKVLQITETVSLAEIVEVGVGGVKKTRLFLILGDLAVQLTGD